MPRDDRTRTDLKVIIVLLATGWIGALIFWIADGHPSLGFRFVALIGILPAMIYSVVANKLRKPPSD
jgi:hypothetical protein